MIHKTDLDGLLAQRILTRPEHEKALNLLPAEPWPAWAGRRLLVVAAALLFSAVICFFAYNWDRMGLVLKFSLPLIGLMLCGAGAWKYTLSSVPGQIFAVGAGVLCGVFTAVCGQTFQLQSFLYEWFLAWSVMLAVLAAVSGVRWLWWGAVFVWYLFASEKYGGYQGFYFLAPSVILFWAVSEVCIYKKVWPKNFRLWAFLPAAVYLVLCAAHSLRRYDWLLPCVMFVAFLVVSSWLALRYLKDAQVLGVNALSAAVWVSFWLVQKQMYRWEGSALLFMAVFGLAGFGAWQGITYIRRTK